MTELLQTQSPLDESLTRQYQAIGAIEGTIIPGETLKIQIADRQFSIFCPYWLKEKLAPGQTQVFRVYPRVSREGLGFQIVSVLQEVEPALSFVLKGCWESPHWGDRLVIYRNPDPRPSKSYKPISLPLVWENAPAPNGQFWELQAELQEDQLVVTAADGPYPPPPRYKPPRAEGRTVPRPIKKAKPKTVSDPASIPVPSALPLSPQEIRAMAIPAKVEVTCKISEVPPHRLVGPGMVEFFLADGDRILTVRLKEKQFKKLTTHGFSSWVAAIAGQLGPATDTGFELVNASIQVFERKPKESASPPAETSGEAIVETSPPQSTPQPKGPSGSAKIAGNTNAAIARTPGKGLLRNVQVR